jgi:hypothetical protein
VNIVVMVVLVAKGNVNKELLADDEPSHSGKKNVKKIEKN